MKKQNRVYTSSIFAIILVAIYIITSKITGNLKTTITIFIPLAIILGILFTIIKKPKTRDITKIYSVLGYILGTLWIILGLILLGVTILGQVNTVLAIGGVIFLILGTIAIYSAIKISEGKKEKLALLIITLIISFLLAIIYPFFL